MAVDPTTPTSQHGRQHAAEHHLRPGRTLLRLVWPQDRMSGPYVPDLPGPHQLWAYKGRKPRWPWNIRVLADGTVDQREGMTQDELSAGVFVLWGGHRVDLEEGSWLHQVLVAAGYEFVPRPDGYGESVTSPAAWS